VYEKTEALFTKLADEQKKYAEWVALGRALQVAPA
jgi:hypothetical protein